MFLACQASHSQRSLGESPNKSGRIAIHHGLVEHLSHIPAKDYLNS
jgi:hypothetical protein